MAQGASAAHVVPLDLREEASVIAAARQAAALAPSGLSYLFLLAGGTQRSAAEETSGEVEADMFALNCLSLMALTKAALPALQAATRSRIVVLSSAAGKLASPGQAGYAGSKHALNGFFGSLRAELASTSVRVTLVCPGPVATGAPGQPRVTFGATLGASTLGGSDAVSAAGAAGTKETARLPVSRAAALTVAAAAHGVREAWLAKHPVLLLLFLTQYAPLLGAAIVDKVGPKRVRAARQGGDMYALAK
jgi:dehydrogenase/reductase SDR family protein 7